MHLRQFLTIASVSAFAIQSESAALCSAAIKTLGDPTVPPALGEEHSSAELSKEELDVLSRYQCSKDPNCPARTSRGIQPMASSPPLDGINVTDLKARMSRNESSIQVFKWGYRIYIPRTVLENSFYQYKQGCGLIDGPLQFCYGKLSDGTQHFAQFYAYLLMCSVMVGPWATCETIKNGLTAIDQQGGAILSATWQTTLKPTIKAANDYYTE